MQGARLEAGAVRHALEEAVLEVLETMCFEFPIAGAEPGGAPACGAVRAAAQFDGSLRGVLHVALTGEAAHRLAASFLGLDEHDVGEQEVILMASELANMLCGATMSRLEPHGRLRIAPPQAGRSAVPCPDQCWLQFPLEEGELAATLAWEEES